MTHAANHEEFSSDRAFRSLHRFSRMAYSSLDVYPVVLMMKSSESPTRSRIFSKASRRVKPTCRGASSASKTVTFDAVSSIPRRTSTATGHFFDRAISMAFLRVSAAPIVSHGISSDSISQLSSIGIICLPWARCCGSSFTPGSPRQPMSKTTGIPKASRDIETLTG